MLLFRISISSLIDEIDSCLINFVCDFDCGIVSVVVLGL